MSIARKKAGRISPVLMGDYDNSTIYRRLDWVYYGGTSYICKKNNTVGINPSDTERWQKIIDKVSDMSIVFSDIPEKVPFTSGESLSVIIGKIKKYISDLKTVAFTGKYIDLIDTPIAMKNPNSLNVKFNGITQASYDGSSAKEVNITPSGIGATNASALLNTTEQISANTNADNITGALATKAIMADYNNKINTINSNFAFREQVNVLPSLGASVYFSVIFSHGRMRQLIATIGNIQSRTSVKVTQLPQGSCPAHVITRKPIIGVPNGSTNNYLLAITIEENGEVYISNYSGELAVEVYADVVYLSAK